MTRSLSAFITLLFLGLSLSAQKEYTAEYWEENWRDWPRPVFDYSIQEFSAVENIVLREYFPSNSNSTGERYFHYARFQYPSLESIENWSKLLFQLPNYRNLVDIDFRIWDGDILAYEARASSLKDQFLDTLSADPHSGKLYAFSIQFPDLKPGQIVEVMISVNGVPMPYELGFHQSFPINKSVQRLKITSAYPLKYSASKEVEASEKKVFDNLFYNFELLEIPAISPELGLSTLPAEFPHVKIDWLDQVFIYDREENLKWENVLENLFYEGDLRDYAVYKNSLDYEFGIQQYYGSWIRPVRYFHERPESLYQNQNYAEGRWRLSQVYANRWLKVEEKLDLIIEENAVPDFDTALQMIYRSQKKASLAYLKQMPVAPPLFAEYGLLCSHYESLFKYFKKEYRLALYYPQRAGLPDLDYVSPWPAYARGLAYREGPDAAWQFVFPGPYFGQFYHINQCPPDLQGGRALLFDRDSVNPSIVSLPAVNREDHGFSHHYKVEFKPIFKRFVLRDTLHLKGAFQSILASAYLRSDSAKDQLSFTNNQLLYNGLLNDSIQVYKSKSLKIEDTINLALKLNEARSIIAQPFNDRSFALPMPFNANWQFLIQGQDSLNYKLELPLKEELWDNPVFKLKVEWEQRGPKLYHLNVALELKKNYLPKEEVYFFLLYQKLVQEAATVKLYRE